MRSGVGRICIEEEALGANLSHQKRLESGLDWRPQVRVNSRRAIVSDARICAGIDQKRGLSGLQELGRKSVRSNWQVNNGAQPTAIGEFESAWKDEAEDENHEYRSMNKAVTADAIGWEMVE